MLLTLERVQHLIDLEQLDIEVLQIVKYSTGLSFKLIQRVDEFYLLADLIKAACLLAKSLGELFDLGLNDLVVTSERLLLGLLLLELRLHYLLLGLRLLLHN